MVCRENEGFQKMKKFKQLENERTIFDGGLFRMICCFFYPVFEVKSRLGSGKDILIEEAYLGPC